MRLQEGEELSGGVVREGPEGLREPQRRGAGEGAREKVGCSTTLSLAARVGTEEKSLCIELFTGQKWGWISVAISASLQACCLDPLRLRPCPRRYR